MCILSAVASALQVVGAASAVSFCWGIAAVAYARTQVHVTETSLPKYILIPPRVYIYIYTLDAHLSSVVAVGWALVTVG